MGERPKDPKDPTAPEGAKVGDDEQVSASAQAAPADTDARDGAQSDARSDQGSEAGSRADSRTGAANPGQPAERAERAEIELPEVAVERLDGDKSILERTADIDVRNTHPVTGIWEQIEGPRDSDFAPGGYARSVLMLNPALKTASVYRVFRGDITMVIGGELALDASLPSARATSGELTIREDPSSTSKFRRTSLAIGGNPAVVVSPPQGEGPWELPWKRDGMELVVGDKRYAAITREAFESIRRGGGDIASEADKSDRIERRPADAATRRVNETSFFGLRGGGKRICFIVDVSGSMAGTKLDRLKEELTITIESLKPDTRFSVVFFDSATHAISQGWMWTDADRKRAVGVIAMQAAGTGTDPSGAFQFAFSSLDPLPDCIYYMTDGQTDADVAGMLRSLNAGKTKTTVHAIAFGDRQLEGVMKQIAAENNGSYLFVP